MSRVSVILKSSLIGLMAASTVALTAARADDAPFKKMLPDAVQSKGFLSVASEIQYPPFETFADDNKTVVGIDADVAAALGKELGVELRFVSTSFDAIIPGLVAKRYDMAMSAMTDNKTRQKQVDFVDYFGSGGAIMARTADKDKYVTLDDLCGVTVGIAKGTTEVADAEKQSAKCQAAGKKPIDSQIFGRQDDMVLALQSGRVAAAMADAPNSAATAQGSKGQLALTGPAYDKAVFGVVVPKGDDQLAKAIQAALQKIMDDGTYLAILKKYGQEDNAITKATINGGTTD
jgi:polar amino acid transport system substrate-binding protein